MSNPFNYSEPLSPYELIDRKREAEQLLDRAFGGHNSRLVAPRRYGKTSLLRRALRDAEREGWATVARRRTTHTERRVPGRPRRGTAARRDDPQRDRRSR